MQIDLTTLVRRIKQRAYLDSDEEIARWIEEYCEQSNSHKHSVSGKQFDFKDLERAYEEGMKFQADYPEAKTLSDFLNQIACASGAGDKTVSCGSCDKPMTLVREGKYQCDNRLCQIASAGH